jgi:transcriptional regulator
MHPNPAFRQIGPDRNLDFARSRGFGILAVAGPTGPLVSHVPFLIAPDGASLDLHLVRSNPILAVLPAPAVIAVSGPDGYVSPDWYGVADQVPTWNYIAVHLRGVLGALPPQDMRDLLDRQSAGFESRLAPKQPWTVAKMSPDARDRMMRAIIPCRMPIAAIDGTWKLGQNKPEEVRLAAAAGMERSGIGAETRALAALMRAPPPG